MAFMHYWCTLPAATEYTAGIMNMNININMNMNPIAPDGRLQTYHLPEELVQRPFLMNNQLILSASANAIQSAVISKRRHPGYCAL
jgi:hypothetical protein